MLEPLVTAIVSTYGAERFIRGCLEDLVAQTIFDQMEVLVIDSGSLEGESLICEEFVKKYPQIRLIRTEREPLYVAWNRAIPLARGKYLTSANTDDRHRKDFMEVMVDELERSPDVALAYAEQYLSEIENETFEQCELRKAKVQLVPEYSPTELMLRCITGSQPVWRKSLHDELGYFNTKYSIAADYDMWLRIASRYRLIRASGPKGVFFISPHTISGANSKSRLNVEILKIQTEYMKIERWWVLPGIRKRLAAELFGRGYQCIERDNDNRAALPFIREAIKLDPTNIRYLKTYIVRRVAAATNSTGTN